MEHEALLGIVGREKRKAIKYLMELGIIFSPIEHRHNNRHSLALLFISLREIFLGNSGMRGLVSVRAENLIKC